MSLVDYASSSDDDIDAPQPKHEEDKPPHQHHPPPPPPPAQTELQQQEVQVPPSIEKEKLPDASLLLNSSPSHSSSQINASDHSSRVAAALAENASRKRDSNGMPSSALSSKVPRGNLSSRSRNIPDTAGGVLRPPQISGRSNVVTEDMGKLFVKKQGERR